ncbi:MAG: four helix bundle protein, partial [Cytophagia bacterium]|nr:four helix bundle protein [Cytophagia bacterium]
NNDQAYFSNIAYSSALETIDHLIYAYDMEYISEEVYSDMRIKLDEIINKVNSLYKFQISQSEGLKDKLKK